MLGIGTWSRPGAAGVWLVAVALLLGIGAGRASAEPLDAAASKTAFVMIEEVAGPETLDGGQVWLKTGLPSSGLDAGCLDAGQARFVMRIEDAARASDARRLAETAKTAGFPILVEYAVVETPHTLADGAQTRCEFVRLSLGD